MQQSDEGKRPPQRARWRVVATLVALAALILVGVSWWRGRSGSQTAVRQPQAIPVTVTAAATRDVPIFLDALGTVQAFSTVAVRSQVDGRVQSVTFQEGQQVKQGDTLAIIDPRPFQANYDQAVAKKEEDQAQYIAATKDLARFKELAGKGFGTQQSVDQQQGRVDQLKATVDADQAAIESAQTQLSYATITAPVDGRVGFRQVDMGNIIHANDPNPLTVITQIRPIVAVFTLPQKNLVGVREAMLEGEVPVVALDPDNRRKLADGKLLLIDNQIDQTTSTIRLKAQFPNQDDRLWPGEFVRVRIQVYTHKGAVTIPPEAVQRGPKGLYAWVIKPNNTADARSIEARTVDADVTIVDKGLTAGERVAIAGQSRLQPGSRVDAKTEDEAKVAQKPS